METKVSAKATFGEVITIQINQNPADPRIIVDAGAQILTTIPPLYKLTLDVSLKD
ncbi:hypothetical protein HZI73_16905 [Vallitalea pronyensis]|uniref:Uncharacterized protein n=1 Tax=Vallitalea pronyensis TaxID=1348613 RepID=A0A8J8MM76_9FIRM|nr:hypothetical protein [Vallitalea pronyensis]QUI23868.1 hypothetical protein HZI73_16905 [Vallitalea pronyensis]